MVKFRNVKQKKIVAPINSNQVNAKVTAKKAEEILQSVFSLAQTPVSVESNERMHPGNKYLPKGNQYTIPKMRFSNFLSSFRRVRWPLAYPFWTFPEENPQIKI